MIKDYIRFPQRKIKKNYRSVTGHFPSVKNNKSLSFESLLEKAHFLLLEFDNSVKEYYEQPQIEILFKEKIVTYSIDCYIHRTKESGLKDTLIEVKYAKELVKEKEYFEEKFKATRKFTNDNDLSFDLFTDESYTEIYLDNLDFLYRFKLNPITNILEENILELFSKKPISAYELSQKISNNPIEYANVSNCIWDLVSKEKVKTNLQKEKLSMHSILEVM